MVASLVFMPPTLAQSNTVSFPYLGMSLDGKMSVVDTYAGSPAARAGMIRGDRIVSIGDTPVEKVNHARAVALLRGGQGVPVTLTVSRGLKLYRVTLIHESRQPATKTGLDSQAAGSAQSTRSEVIQSTIPANAEQSASQFDNLDKKLVVVNGKTELTEEVLSAVAKGLRLLPASVKQRLLDFGVTVFVTPRLEDGSGRTEYEPRLRRVVICEQNTDGTTVDIPRLHIVTLHELGHAYDHMLNYPSRSPEWKEVYNSEAPHVPAEHQAILSHFLKPANCASECFASLFACKYFNGDDRRLNALKADFPRCLSLMQHY